MECVCHRAQATFLAFTLTSCAIIYANRNITGFRNASKIEHNLEELIS